MYIYFLQLKYLDECIIYQKTIYVNHLKTVLFVVIFLMSSRSRSSRNPRLLLLYHLTRVSYFYHKWSLLGGQCPLCIYYTISRCLIICVSLHLQLVVSSSPNIFHFLGVILLVRLLFDLIHNKFL